MENSISILKNQMENSKYTVAITGSGISHSYGMGRLKKTTNRMDLMRKLTPQYVKYHPEEFYQLMKDSFLDATFKIGPSKAHLELAELEKRGILQGIVTQNFDCLHQVAGSKYVIEFQGSFNDNICVNCGKKFSGYEIWNKGYAPRCDECGSPLMPVSFMRNANDNSKMNEAKEMISKANLIIIIGTSGFRSDEYFEKLNPNTFLVQINPSETIFDTEVNLNIRENAEDVLGQILDEI